MCWKIPLNPLNSAECNKCAVSIIMHMALDSILQGATMQKTVCPKWWLFMMLVLLGTAVQLVSYG